MGVDGRSKEAARTGAKTPFTTCEAVIDSFSLYQRL